MILDSDTTHGHYEPAQSQVKNALRYFPPSCHAELAPEFAQELAEYGHIYMYRWLQTAMIMIYHITNVVNKGL